jgi:Domain of unknown function (DUF4349)
MGSINNNTHRRRRAFAVLVLTGTVAVTACGGGGDDDSAASQPLAAGEATAEMSVAESSGDGVGGFIEDTAEGGIDTDRNGGFDIGVIGRDVIVEMRVVLSSDNIQRSVASIMASASSLGGGVASSDVNYGADDGGFAVLVVKVPPQAVDRLLAGLDDTGEVQSINQSAQDVTEQLVNLDIRITNARQSVSNVRGFMESTTNLNELVSLEAELTRRQTELEQLEAQQRNISDRVALSTVTIEVVPSADIPAPVVDEKDDGSIGGALRAGWTAFAAVLFGIAFVVAATLPFLIVGLVLALVIWSIVRRRDRRTATGLPAPITAREHDTAETSAEKSDMESEPESERDSEPVG